MILECLYPVSPQSWQKWPLSSAGTVINSDVFPDSKEKREETHGLPSSMRLVSSLQFIAVKCCVNQEKNRTKDLGLVLVPPKITKIVCFLYLLLSKIFHNHERGCVANPQTFSLKKWSALKRDLVLQFFSMTLVHR